MHEPGSGRRGDGESLHLKESLHLRNAADLGVGRVAGNVTHDVNLIRKRR
jgi:hypothetical protein